MCARMATVQISFKMDTEIRDKIEGLITAGRYRGMSDFIHHAISRELSGGKIGSEEWIRREATQSIRDDIAAGRYDDLLEVRVRNILAHLLTGITDLNNTF